MGSMVNNWYDYWYVFRSIGTIHQCVIGAFVGESSTNRVRKSLKAAFGISWIIAGVRKISLYDDFAYFFIG